MYFLLFIILLWYNSKFVPFSNQEMFKPQQVATFKNKNIRFNNSLQALKSTLSNPNSKVRKFRSDYLLFAKTLITQLQ